MRRSLNRPLIQGLIASSVFALSACATLEPVRVARVEMHGIATTTLTDQQYLTGGKGGMTTTIAGELRIPTLGKDKLPAVVLLHGARGVLGFVDDWARELNALGVATFIPDSVTGRGVDSIVKVGRLAALEDAYRSLDLLAKHPRIDANRVAVMGFGSGGQVALASAMKRFQRVHAGEGSPGFAAYIAFYPICHYGFREREDVVAKPIRIFHGSADHVAPIEACKSYVTQLNKAGKDARIYEYVGAGHVFDWVMQKEPRRVPDAQLTGKCRLEEGDGGVMLNGNTGKPFTPKDACVEKGTTFAYHAAAHQAALKDLREFVQTVLKTK